MLALYFDFGKSEEMAESIRGWLFVVMNEVVKVVMLNSFDELWLYFEEGRANACVLYYQ